MARKPRNTGAAKAAEITSLKKLRTPKGIAAFAWLSEPDVSFNKERFRISVFFPEFKTDPEFVKFLADLRKLNAEFVTSTGRKPDKTPSCMKVTSERLSEVTGQPVGTPYMEFESKAKEDSEGIPVYNAGGQKDPGLKVFGGDIIRVETQIAGWNLSATGAGIKGYLRAVQLLKSNWSGGAGSTFEEETEYLNESAPVDADKSVAANLEEEYDGEAEEAPFDAEEDPIDNLL